MSSSTETARRAARNAGALALAGVFSKGIQFAWMIVLARWLGGDGSPAFGIYGTVGALAPIATVIGSFGMGLIVVRDVSRQPSLAGRYLTATLFMQTLLVLVAFLVMNAAGYVIGYSAAIRVYIALTGAGLIIDIYGNMSSDQLLAQERMVTTSLVETLHILVRIGLIAAALWSRFDLLGLYVAGLLASAMRSGVFWWALMRSGVRPVFPLDRDIARPLFVNSTPLAVSAILTLAYQQADKLMSTRLLNEVSTGYLTAAFILIMAVIELLNSTILIATYPIMSRTYDDNRDMFGFIVEKLIVFTVLITLPIALVMSVFSPLVTSIFGPSFAPTAGVLRVLIWYAVAAMVVNVFAQAMMVQNRQRRLLFIRMGGLALNLTLNVTLLTAFNMGVMGLVYASVAAEAVVLVVMLLTFREAGVDTARLVRRSARPMLAGLVVGVVMVWLGAVHVVLGGAVGLILYAGAVMFGGLLGDDDWDLLYRLLGAMPGGAVVLRLWPRTLGG